MSEYFYFSSTTFFTVGYGDVEIRGRIPKIIVQSQMFLANILNVIFVPLMLFFITDYISKGSKKTKILHTNKNLNNQNKPSVEKQSIFPPRSVTHGKRKK
ncbi:ion channel [Paenibacillus hunanensis]|uniref:ion channel n=1 Tax=Paenibacillus hunanensis TaxID=539262 RepID=UPI003D6C4433